MARLIKERWYLEIAIMFMIPLFISSIAYSQSSPNYRMEMEVFSSGGEMTQSIQHDFSFSLGEPSASGHSSSNNFIIYGGFWNILPEAPEGYSLSLGAGWNLISLPLQPFETDISSVLGQLSGLFTMVWSYQNGKWWMYDPANIGFSDLTTMEAGHAYWIEMTQAGVLNIAGSEPSKSLKLTTGWNFVGFNSNQSMPVNDALSSISTKLVIVWSFRDGVWKMYDPAHPGFSDLTTMEPGYGYWVKVTENCIWEIP
jgi:hypothetical protein